MVCVYCGFRSAEESVKFFIFSQHTFLQIKIDTTQEHLGILTKL